MAKSPSHTWGQIVGNIVERGVVPILSSIASDYDLYLDSIGPRGARPGKKVTWTDRYGNKHDLDYVLERGGTEEVLGTPVGFVEVAWRRYTKHSKNKAQEIQGAVMPLVESFPERAPFMGAIIAGEFTSGALDQLTSLGFDVLYFPYIKVVEAFRVVHIDASFGEDTAVSEFEAKIEQWTSLSSKDQDSVVGALISLCRTEVDEFTAALRQTIGRTVKSVLVLPLYGSALEFSSLAEARHFLNSGLPKVDKSGHAFERVEVQIRYSNGDKVEGAFGSSQDASAFIDVVTG